VDETFGTPSTSLTTPSLLYPEGLVSRSSSWLFRPLRDPYQLQSAIAIDKDLKKHGDLDQQARFNTLAIISWPAS
jgi:hypothetical protein